MEERELTRKERGAIRKLVTNLCANYDPEYGCLPLDAHCYMLGKCWTGDFCRYFQRAVLPTEPALEAALLRERPHIPPARCPICGKEFLPDGRMRYCSGACAHAAHRRQQRVHMRKKRGRSVDN